MPRLPKLTFREIFRPANVPHGTSAVRHPDVKDFVPAKPAREANTFAQLSLWQTIQVGESPYIVDDVIRKERPKDQKKKQCPKVESRSG